MLQRDLATRVVLPRINCSRLAYIQQPIHLCNTNKCMSNAFGHRPRDQWRCSIGVGTIGLGDNLAAMHHQNGLRNIGCLVLANGVGYLRLHHFCINVSTQWAHLPLRGGKSAGDHMPHCKRLQRNHPIAQSVYVGRVVADNDLGAIQLLQRRTQIGTHQWPCQLVQCRQRFIQQHHAGAAN
ncbi:unannotated protein [freshwater metagenome]|uniref:Unannotated protein n=1 Tax=freshwater metagenome TaxID=449393 RepID=A0A6J6KCZ7_9ZZZZ